MKKKKIALCMATIVLLQAFCICVHALDFDVDIKYTDNMIKFYGTATSSDYIVVEVVNSDTDFSNIWDLIDSSKKSEISGDIQVAYNAGFPVFTDDTETDVNGEFSIDATIKTSGEYLAVLYSEAEDKVYEKAFVYTNKETYTNIIDTLNGYFNSNDKDGFKIAVDDVKNEIGYNNNDYSDVSFESIVELIYNELKRADNALSTVNADYNKNLYETAALITALNESKDIENVDIKFANLSITDSNFDKYITQIIKNGAAETLFLSIIRNEKIKDFPDFEKRAKEALILTGIKYPDGWKNIQNLFEIYGKDIMGLDSVSKNAEVYRSLSGKSYNTINDMVKDYKKYVKNSTQSQGGSGGSGGSGGGGTGNSVSNSSGISNIVLPSVNDDGNTVALKIKFEDLDSVDWAYDAIAKLYEMGIIDGVNDYSFKPDMYVTREQFVKMLVSAMGLQKVDVESAGFSDVENGSWYEKYVNIAFSKGLIEGVGSNNFGVGDNISRQDMAVMVYNALEMNGYKLNNAQLLFEDAENCANYAIEAIAELNSAEIITGVDNNYFAPLDTATRAQAAVIINRALKYLQ